MFTSVGCLRLIARPLDFRVLLVQFRKSVLCCFGLFSSAEVGVFGSKLQTVKPKICALHFCFKRTFDLSVPKRFVLLAELRLCF
jgi:hypothetical protein